MKVLSTLTLLTLMTFSTAAAKLVSKTVDYTDEKGAALEGYYVYDDATPGPRPGVLVVHDWRGLTDTTKNRANMLAGLGYAALAVDIYGKGVHPQTVTEYGQTMTPYKQDRSLYRLRLRAGLAEIRKHAEVDPKKIAAIGYCFGGTGVIELARDGADVLGVVSFHGGLDSPSADGKNIKCKVLALCGADDPFENPADFKAFQEDLKSSGVDYSIISYGHAVHAFTDHDVDLLNLPGAKYNEKADKRSWQAMKDFFDEIFA
jgi:dienelactone hydrolase